MLERQKLISPDEGRALESGKGKGCVCAVWKLTAVAIEKGLERRASSANADALDVAAASALARQLRVMPITDDAWEGEHMCALVAIAGASCSQHRSSALAVRFVSLK